MYGFIWEVLEHCAVTDVSEDCQALFGSVSAKSPSMDYSAADDQSQSGRHSSAQSKLEQTTWPVFFQRVGYPIASHCAFAAFSQSSA
jgi:hypothetical protein